jgi:hypothetical protein
MLKEGWEKGTIGDISSKQSKLVKSIRQESKRTLVLDYGMKN